MPAVNQYWEDMQSGLLDQQQCPVIANKIVALPVVDCRETHLNSVVMEKVGLMRAMSQVMKKVTVAEVVTDAHPQIRKLMSK